MDGRAAEDVQVACDKAAEAGVPVVFLPAGEYVFDTEVKVPRGLTVLGEGVPPENAIWPPSHRGVALNS